MAKDIKVASIYASTQFRIDKESEKNLDRFLKKIKQLEKITKRVKTSVGSSSVIPSVQRRASGEDRMLEKVAKLRLKAQRQRERDEDRMAAKVTKNRYKEEVERQKSLKRMDKLHEQAHKEDRRRTLAGLSKEERDRALAARAVLKDRLAQQRRIFAEQKRIKSKESSIDEKNLRRRAKKAIATEDKILDAKNKLALKRQRLGIKEEDYRVHRESLERLSRQFRSGDISAREFNRRLAQINSTMSVQTNRTNGLVSSYRSLRRAMISLTASYSAFSAVSAIAETGKGFESAETLFGTLFKKDAAQEMQYVRDEAERLGLNILDLSKSYAKFNFTAQKAGVSADMVKTIFESMNEASVVFGTTAEDQQGIFKALIQMFSKGTVSLEELKQQLGDRLPGALNVAAEELGYADNELSKFLKDIEQGRVLARDAVPAIARGMKKIAAPGLVLALENLDRAQTRMTNSFTDFKNTVFKSGLGKGLKEIYEGADEILELADPLAKVIGKLLGGAFQVLGKYIKFVSAWFHDFGVILKEVLNFLSLVNKGGEEFFTKSNLSSLVGLSDIQNNVSNSVAKNPTSNVTPNQNKTTPVNSVQKVEVEVRRGEGVGSELDFSVNQVDSSISE